MTYIIAEPCIDIKDRSCVDCARSSTPTIRPHRATRTRHVLLTSGRTGAVSGAASSPA